MKRAFALGLALLATPAVAIDHTVEYRFYPGDISSVEVEEWDFEKYEEEGPDTIVINGDPEYPESGIRIESGGGDCVELLRSLEADSWYSVVLRIDMNAPTQYGVQIVECSMRAHSHHL